jgi:hypothetical protein
VKPVSEKMYDLPSNGIQSAFASISSITVLLLPNVYCTYLTPVTPPA